MKKIIFLFISCFALFSCATTNEVVATEAPSQKEEIEIVRSEEQQKFYDIKNTRDDKEIGIVIFCSCLLVIVGVILFKTLR